MLREVAAMFPGDQCGGCADCNKKTKLSETFEPAVAFLFQEIANLRLARKSAHARADRNQAECTAMTDDFKKSNKLPLVPPDPKYKSFVVGSGLEQAGNRFVVGQIMVVDLSKQQKALVVYDLEGKVRFGYRLMAMPNRRESAGPPKGGKK